jgi:hypothetical protein
VVVDKSYVLFSKFQEVIANAVTSVLESMYRMGNPLIESHHGLNLWYQSKFLGTETFCYVNDTLCLSKPSLLGYISYIVTNPMVPIFFCGIDAFH